MRSTTAMVTWLFSVPFLVVAIGASSAEVPRVVASIRPIHSLVAGVMDGVGKPNLIVRGYGSPHTYQMRPSDAATLQMADIVFWVGEPLETFLRKPISVLPSSATVVELMKVSDLRLLRNRHGGRWEAGQGDEVNEKDNKHQGNGKDTRDVHNHSFDAHVWLDVSNAKKMVEAIAQQLSAVDEINAAQYKANGAALTKRLEILEAELAEQLEPVKNVPYAAFHDAYHYLEKRYGLNAVGSITASPDRMPSVQRLAELRSKLNELDARCMFTEPQFESALVKTVIEGTDVEPVVLDPLGASFEPGPDAYFQMMEANATAMLRCLSR